MNFSWLKRYMPRGLFGRAALILILPVVTLQLVVSVVFIQRHFEGVTEQMSRSIALEMRYLLSEMDGQETQGDALRAALPVSRAMEYQLSYVAEADVPKETFRRWYDFSGIVVVRELRTRLPNLRVITMPDDRAINVYLDSDLGVVDFSFDRTRVSASNPHQLLVNMVFFGILMTIISGIYLRNQLRPVTRLGRVAEAFGRGQNLPYSPSGAVEVRAAGNAFLSMRARIERQIEQRTMMLSGVSHDLRTPLTRMKLALSMLDEDERAPMERDVEDMQRLLDEFLNFARGSNEGDQEQVNVAQIVEDVVADAQRGGQDVELVGFDKETAPVMVLNPVAMRRALDNLIGNAVRYGSKAQVSVIPSEKSIIFRVEDDGPGLEKEQYGEAIRPFVRLDPARNQDQGTGVGLGLAITNDIARAHGGVLRFGRSKRLGGLRADIVLAR